MFQNESNSRVDIPSRTLSVSGCVFGGWQDLDQVASALGLRYLGVDPGLGAQWAPAKSCVESGSHLGFHWMKALSSETVASRLDASGLNSPMLQSRILHAEPQSHPTFAGMGTTFLAETTCKRAPNSR